MFIHEMTFNECRSRLQTFTVGRLGCVRDKQPYIVPMNFAFDGTFLYGFSTVGQKIEWLRLNPSVCVEIDEIVSQNQWESIVVLGRYEELPDTPECQQARIQAHTLLKRRAMWWEPAYMSDAHREYPHSMTPVFFRIHIDKVTGHRATLDTVEAVLNTELSNEQPSSEQKPVD
jgi:nitroimidazol reductase NimA-like FMN-containing flavoprotein (pyridoxamine 5'-phosphate oxidase superfamily)